MSNFKQYMSIVLNIKTIKESIPDKVKIVAVSKTHSIETIMEAYNTGHRIFGENKVQELITKKNQLPADISWHFIGHLQTNKVKQIVSFVDLIHGVDSFKLLETIDKEAKKVNRMVNCLLQIHIADESTKFGFSEKELLDILSSKIINSFENISVCGLMGMATFTENKQQIKNEFSNLKRFYEYLKINFFNNYDNFKELSMGMSDDYKIAIDEGSTIVRIGSSIFGIRKYV